MGKTKRGTEVEEHEEKARSNVSEGSASPTCSACGIEMNHRIDNTEKRQQE